MARIPGIDRDILPLNLGGNPFGWTADADASFEVLDAFVAGGGSFVDTADVYSAWAPGNEGGESERIIGAWMAERGNRDDIVVATKTGSLEARHGLGDATVKASAREALERLRTDRIDLYYAHRDDPATPIENQVRTFGDLVAEGTILAIGLSNYSPDRLREWVGTADALGLPRPAAIQTRYSLVARHEYERDDAPLVTEFGLASFPYSTLGSGFLSGKYRGVEDLVGARAGAAQRYLDAGGVAVVDVLAGIAQAHGAELTTVALAWLLARGVTAPIASASHAGQVPALLAATTLDLSADEVAALDAASQPFAETPFA